jgi:protein SCO1/2
VRLSLATGLVAAALALNACGSATSREPVAVGTGGESRTGDGTVLHGTEVSDIIPRPALALPDTSGRTFDLRQRPDEELTAVFFGYTRCPDVCPTTVADLASARRQMSDADRQQVQVVFVTEDPETDRPEVLRRWLDQFDTDFIGLVGGTATTEQALDALKAPRTEILPPESTASPHPHGDAGPPDDHSHATGSGQEVEHTGTVHVFHDDRVVLYSGGTAPAEYAADFSALLAE